MNEQDIKNLYDILHQMHSLLEQILNELQLMNARQELTDAPQEDLEDTWEHYQRLRQRWQEYLDRRS